jgi:hypothetical protein
VRTMSATDAGSPSFFFSSSRCCPLVRCLTSQHGVVQVRRHIEQQRRQVLLGRHEARRRQRVPHRAGGRDESKEGTWRQPDGQGSQCRRLVRRSLACLHTLVVNSMTAMTVQQGDALEGEFYREGKGIPII